jgi:hypothetical protein
MVAYVASWILGAFALNGWAGHPLLMAAFSCDTALLDGVFMFGSVLCVMSFGWRLEE